MIELSTDDVIRIHSILIRQTGGSDGLRDRGLLESALNGAFATWEGVDLYRGTLQKAAKIGHSLIANHAFIDGNKRIGMLAMLTYATMCGVTLSPADDDIINIAMNVASGNATYSDVLAFLTAHSK